jgi:hypothetical protein
MSSGKGRCDLMPLEVISNLMDSDFLSEISNYRKTNRTVHLYNALRIFIRDNYATMEDAMLALSVHFENGAKKYGENNWQLGLPESCYIDSAVRHSLKHGRGDKDEPHNAATMWNLVCLIWQHDHNKNGGAED